MRQQARKREHAVHNKPSFESEYGSHRYAWIDRHTWIEITSTAAEVQHRVPSARVLQPLAENLAHEGLICRVPIIVSAGLAVCVRAGGVGVCPACVSGEDGRLREACMHGLRAQPRARGARCAAPGLLMAVEDVPVVGLGQRLVGAWPTHVPACQFGRRRRR